MSQLSRVANVFFAPTSTFTDIKRNPSWWLAWVLVGLSSLLLAFAVQQKIGFVQAYENTLRMTPKQLERIDQMPADRQQAARDVGAKITEVRAYAAPVFSLLFAAISAGILLGVFNFGLGTEVRFSEALAIVFYAGLPHAVKNILAAGAIFLGMSPEGFLFDNPLGSNPGFYMDPAKSLVWYGLGSALDVFAIWSLLLTALGFATVSKKKPATAIAIVLILYALTMLLGMGVAALFA
jgi:Yip1 domain